MCLSLDNLTYLTSHKIFLASVAEISKMYILIPGSYNKKTTTNYILTTIKANMSLLKQQWCLEYYGCFK